MFTDFLPLLLRFFPALTIIAIVIAAAGHYRGSAGATVAVKSIWVVAFIAQCLVWGSWWAPIRTLVIIAIATTVSLTLIYLPMRLPRGWTWLKGRLILGLAGAAVAAVLLAPMVLILACASGVDCI